jgi:hypothetical protein
MSPRNERLVGKFVMCEQLAEFVHSEGHVPSSVLIYLCPPQEGEVCSRDRDRMTWRASLPIFV